MNDRKSNYRKQQQGFGTLTISVIILFLISMVTLYTMKTTMKEQQIYANQYRSDQALSAANAGLDYIIAYYNRYGWDQDGNGIPDYTSVDPKNVSIIDTADELSVTAEAYFDVVSADAITIGARGHSDDQSAIRTLLVKITDPGLFGDEGEGTIDYPLISRNDVSITGNISVVNRFSHKTIWTGTSELNWGAAETFVKDPHYTGEWTHEMLVNADPEHSGKNYTMVASKASSGVNSDVIYDDPNLRNLEPDDFFGNFFIENKLTIRRYAGNNEDGNGDPQVYPGSLGWGSIAGKSPKGLIWVDGNLEMKGNEGTIGSQSDPVVMVVDGNFTNTGAGPTDISLYGVLYITGYWDTAGNMTIQGSVIVEDEFGSTERGHGNPMIVFDPTLFGNGDGDPPLYQAGIITGTWMDWTD